GPDGAAGAGPQQGDLLGGVGSAAEVGDIGDVDPAGDDQFEHRLGQQVPGGADGDGADPGDLAELAVGDAAPPEGFDVHAEEGEVGGVGHRARGGRAGVAGG